MNALEKLLESVSPAQEQEIKKLMIFLNPETEEEKKGAIALLSELVGLETKELAFVNKELEKLTPVGKERARRIVRELRQGRGGGKHQLAGFAMGPAEAEGGPIQAEVITKQATSDALQTLLDAISNNLAEVHVSDKVKVLLNPDGSFYRIIYSGPSGPRSFSQQGSWPIFAAEANAITDAARLLAEALDFEARATAVGKETRQHPLEGLGWMGHSDGGQGQVVTRG